MLFGAFLLTLYTVETHTNTTSHKKDALSIASRFVQIWKKNLISSNFNLLRPSSRPVVIAIGKFLLHTYFFSSV